MKKLFTSIFVCLLGFQMQAQIVVTDDDLQGGNTYNWTSDNEYLLDGFVVLEDGGVLNIEAGTVIKGKASPSSGIATSSALLISKGAKIHAVGTAQNPVIFTAEIDDLNDDSDISFSDRGLWGGLVILGDATIAAEAPTIPFLSPDYMYGGSNDTDSSGVLQYVSIRHSGAETFPDEELDGLYLGGVGSKTVISNIEVYAGQDDAITMSGGTVNLKYLSVAFNSDESIDWDRGWRGKGQFWLALQDADSDRCGEHDGAAPDLADPFSNPLVSNVTYIGPGVDVPNSASEALLFRDRSGGTYANSIFINFPEHAINVEDRDDIEDSYSHIQSGDLLMNCNYWWAFGAGNTWSELVNISVIADDQTGAQLINMMEANQNTIGDPMIVNLDPDPAVFDPRLDANSPALNGGCAINDPFFDQVSYIGAFDEEAIWLQEWTGMDANLFFAFNTTSTNSVEEEQKIQIFPNPTSDAFTVEGLNGAATMRLFSSAGHLLQEQVVNNNTANMDISTLPVGMYLLQVQSEAGIISKKITKVQ